MRRNRYLHVAFLAFLTAWTAWSCGTGRGAPRTVAPAAAPPRVPSAARLTGQWHWALATEVPGARRFEAESWHLRARDGAIAGRYERVLTVLSTDGVPFACNQMLQYQLRAIYRFEGDYDGSSFTLRETGYETLPSPCEKGARALTAYRGEVRAQALVLRWEGGSQTLQPALPGSRVAPRAALPASERPATPAGTWRWRGRTLAADTGEVRVEREDWALTETPAGLLTGTLTRTVTVFEERGRFYECSDDTYYEYRDRYQIRGRRAGMRLTLSEVAVEADDHPCLAHRTRHLDTATGVLVGGQLILTWRGQRRQVLHRP